MGTVNSIKRHLGFIIVITIIVAWARPASAIEYQISIPQEFPNNIQLAPGQSGVFSFDVQNLSAEAGTARLDIVVFNGLFLLDEGQPSQCGPIDSRGFPVALQAGQSLRCSYRLYRHPASTSDFALGACTGVRNSSSPCTISSYSDPGLSWFYAGAVPDIGISASATLPVVPGATESIIRLTATNASSLATRDIPVYSECLPTNQQYPYSLDNSIPGGCSFVDRPIGCQIAIGIPPAIAQWVISLPAAPPMSESSCLVRMRFNDPLATSFSDTLSLGIHPLIPVTLALGDNYFGYDPNPANDTTPFGAVLSSVAVPVGDQVTWFVLCGILVGIAWRRRTIGRKSI